MSILNLLYLPLIGLLILITLNFNYFFYNKYKTIKLSQKVCNNLLKGVSLYFLTANFFFSIVYMYLFEKAIYGFQFCVIFNIFNNFFTFGIDGISLLLIVLTLFLMPICIIISWDYIVENTFFYLISFIILEIFLILFFSSLNLLFIYLSFESVLIPMFFIIGLWGSNRKIKAAYYFFMFTLFGSVFMLLAILIIWAQAGSLELIKLINFSFSPNLSVLLFILLSLGFAVKIPLFPLHLWLPEAHVEAPTSGSVLLAGVLLKLGGYGFIRVCLTLFSKANWYVIDIFMLICGMSGLYSALAGMVQNDMKKLVAYSSISHMGFSLMCLLPTTLIGVSSCVLTMISHGLISSALFICVDILYRRTGTKTIYNLAGLCAILPNFKFFFFYFTLANIGFPGTSSFFGELSTIVALFSYSPTIAILFSIVLIFTPIFSIWLFINLFWQSYFDYNKNRLFGVNVIYKDLTFMEFLVLFIFLVLSQILGLFPDLVLQIIESSVIVILEAIDN